MTIGTCSNCLGRVVQTSEGVSCERCGAISKHPYGPIVETIPLDKIEAEETKEKETPVPSQKVVPLTVNRETTAEDYERWLTKKSNMYPRPHWEFLMHLSDQRYRLFETLPTSHYKDLLN